MKVCESLNLASRPDPSEVKILLITRSDNNESVRWSRKPFTLWAARLTGWTRTTIGDTLRRCLPLAQSMAELLMLQVPHIETRV